MAQWFNEDGLRVLFGSEQAAVTTNGYAQVMTMGNTSQMVVDLLFNDLPTFTTDRNNDGTKDGFCEADPYIPAKSYITRAILICEEDWATADAATLDIGLYELDGTAIVADGIDVDIAASALDLGDVVLCNGSLVGGTVWVGTDDCYLVAAAVTGTYTSGKAKLVIEYITVDV